MKVRLHVQDGPQSFEFEHGGPAVAVGRNPEGDLVLEQDAPSSVVSWDHARIDLSPREATLTDLRSTNGTFRNEQPVLGTVTLWPGDAIRLGASGPVLKVLELDLSPEALPTPKAAPQAAAAAPPAAAPVAVAKAARPKKAAPVPAISETRGILLEAIRVQQTAHSRQKRGLATVAGACLLLLLLLGGGLWSLRGRLGELFGRTEKLQDDVADTQKSVEQFGREMRAKAQETAEHFTKVEQTLEDQRKAQDEQFARINEVAQQQLRQEAALKGGLDKLKRDLGATLDQINDRLAKPGAGGGAVRPQAAAVARDGPSPRIEPGMKMDVIVKNKGYYTGVLLGISGEKVRLQTVPDPKAQPHEWDLREVQAFQTRDGLFAYNESTGAFEPALTFYRFDKSAGQFARADTGAGSASLAQDAQVLGPTRAVKALLSVGRAGEWCVGLPVPASQSPESIPAYHFKEIVTAKGVYTYDDQQKDYVFKAHSELAAEAKAKRDEFWKQREQQQYDRRVKAYELGTERLKALAPYFWGRWWWW
jgi:hypothetical protein